MLTEARRLLRDPLFITTALVAVGVLLFLLWKAPGRPEVPAVAGPLATPFPTITPGPSPTFGPPPTAGPPTATATPDRSSQTRDEIRQRDLLTIAGIIQRYADAEGEVPITGQNVQSLCVFQELDVGCAFREYADHSELPNAPAGEPYAYLSEDGRAWAIFATLENGPSIPCAHPRVGSLPDPPRTICISGVAGTPQ
jgi:hypothetical protein